MTINKCPPCPTSRSFFKWDVSAVLQAFLSSTSSILLPVPPTHACQFACQPFYSWATFFCPSRTGFVLLLLCLTREWPPTRLKWAVFAYWLTQWRTTGLFVTTLDA
eukprot:GABV01006877.1.p1 GENE.GABV01006877.1~~GABV01006877.1.p1  ORF type:complete len:118 (-),score=16.77 GABV01006877.1:3-320(-)